MPFRITSRVLTLPVLPNGVRSVDVCFEEHRVWSIDLGAIPTGWRSLLRGRMPLSARSLAWPTALRPHLVGRTTIILRDSSDGHELARTEVTFSDDDRPTRVVDAAGTPLAVNKWGRLGRTLDESGMQDRILDHAQELVERLGGLGLRPFVVGGTLLGAVRGGALLPHDDDADLAYLSEHTDPTDVAREGLSVGRRLEAFGYELVRHSATHMQLYFRDADGRVDHYIDVFAAFFTEDGRINQPFHVRGRMRHEQMLPFGTVHIDGRPFPAPADTDRWLSINYDENWRTPLPGYRLITPVETRRRFENWFGLFNSGRDFWNDYHSEHAGGADWSTGAGWLLAQEGRLLALWCIDLGGGGGALGAALRDAASGPAGSSGGARRRVIVADYSPRAIEAARRLADERLAAEPVNLLQLDSLGLPARAGIDGPFDLVANHLLDQADRQALPQALRLIRMALRSGGSAFVTLYAKRDPGRPDAEPSNGFLAPDRLAVEAGRFGLGIDVTPLHAPGAERRRRPYGVRFHLEERSDDEETA